MKFLALFLERYELILKLFRFYRLYQIKINNLPVYNQNPLKISIILENLSKLSVQINIKNNYETQQKRHLRDI